MSTKCMNCIIRPWTGPDWLCDECRGLPYLSRNQLQRAVILARRYQVAFENSLADEPEDQEHLFRFLDTLPLAKPKIPNTCGICGELTQAAEAKHCACGASPLCPACYAGHFCDLGAI
jgi:hypothetical protein